MTKETNKFHALQLFTDTFTAETVHLSNQAIGIYIRLLSFAWTKNAKPFTTESAYRICQCTDGNCHTDVDDVLKEFFILNFNEETNEESWTHKRLIHEHAYLTDKYQRKSEAGKKGAEARYSANGNIIAPIPSPKPIPTYKIYDQSFESLWKELKIKRGSKFKAYKEFNKINIEEITNEQIVKIYNNQIKGIEEKKYIPHFATWLSQRRWEIEEDNDMPDLVDRLKKLGYQYLGHEGNFEKFTKDGKNYKIDIYDEKHQMQLVQ
jgi:uncharacterized protein YdaU (DUF1376 family)